MHEALAYQIRRAETEAKDLTAEYAETCRRMARTLTEAADRATREQNAYVSTTVMTNSMVLDITALGIRVEAAKDRLKALREVSMSIAEV